MVMAKTGEFTGATAIITSMDMATINMKPINTGQVAACAKFIVQPAHWMRLGTKKARVLFAGVNCPVFPVFRIGPKPVQRAAREFWFHGMK